MNDLAEQILQHIDEQARTVGYKINELDLDQATELVTILRQERPDVMFEIHQSPNGLVLEIHRY